MNKDYVDNHIRAFTPLSAVSLMGICRFYGPGPHRRSAVTHATLCNWVASVQN